MTDLPENTRKQDKTEDEIRALLDWLPDWALQMQGQALFATRAPRHHLIWPDENTLARNVLALCSALAAALRQVHAEKEATGMLADLAADCQAAVEAAVIAERMTWAGYVLAHTLREVRNKAAGILAARYI